MTFNEKNRAWLEPYIRKCADAIGLAGWETVVLDAMPEGYETSNACSWLSDDYDVIRIAFNECETVADVEIPWTPESFRQTMAHELFHAHLRDITNAHKALEDSVAKPAWSVAVDRFDHELERVVDNLARMMAPHLPLPPASKFRNARGARTYANRARDVREPNADVRVIESA